MCCSTTSIKEIAVLYAILTFITFSAELTMTFVFGALTEYHRRPYIWITYGKNAFVRFVNLGAIITWILASVQDNMQGLLCSTVVIASRVVGNFMYGIGNFIYETFFKKMGVIETYKEAALFIIFPPIARLTSILFWTLVEGIMVWLLCTYYTRKLAEEPAPAPPPAETATRNAEDSGSENTTRESADHE